MSGQLPSWPRGRQSESCTQAERPPCPFFLVQDSSTHPLYAITTHVGYFLGFLNSVIWEVFETALKGMSQFTD